MSGKRTFPLGVKYDNMTHSPAKDKTQVRIKQPYPDPELKGHGVVISNGKVKKDKE